MQFETSWSRLKGLPIYIGKIIENIYYEDVKSCRKYQFSTDTGFFIVQKTHGLDKQQ